MRSRRRRLFWIGAVILVAGLIAGATIFLNAGGDEVAALGYDFAGGTSYAVDAGDSKMYRHEIERFGGKAALLADDLNRFIASLWHGKRLALVVAIAALAVAGGFFVAAARAQEPPE
jgi:hypothetical protein